MVQFSHFSVKEFLTSDRLARSRDFSHYHVSLEPAHTILAQVCLGILLQLDNRVIEDNTDVIPLVEYASRHLFDHAGFDKVAPRIRVAMEYFFDGDKPHWTAWSRVQKIDVRSEWFTPSGGSDDASPLYYASLGGFYDLAEHLVGKHPEHINARGGQMVTPLAVALHGKHFWIAELLHRHGADVNARGKSNNTLLHAACIAGNPDIVQWLLNHGADVNTQSDRGSFPISSAVGLGHLQLVRMLLEFNADIDVCRDFGRGLLHMAATCLYGGHVGVMQLLLDHGSNPNARDDGGSTPLHHCSWWQKEGFFPARGSVEGTRLLLEYGAIVDPEDNEGRTPLRLALEHGRQDIATCLREHGATR